MKVALNAENSHHTLTLEGELDHRGAVILRKSLSEHKNIKPTALIMDLKGVHNITSKGLMTLSDWVDSINGSGKIKITGANHYIKESFDESGISSDFIWI